MSKSNIVSTDPIADMLTRVRNAIMVGKDQIELPHSGLKDAVAKILVEQGFLAAVSTDSSDKFKKLQITIAGAGQPAKITEITRLSRPGRRHYVKADEIPAVKHGRGIVVVSTSKGVMTGDQAKAQRLGGELICKVY